MNTQAPGSMTDIATLHTTNTLSLLDALEKAGAVIDNGLFLPDSISYEQYENIGALFGALHRANSWLIGDWLLFGEHKFGEKYAQAAERVGLSPQSLANMASVAKRVPPGRRRADVSFSIHAEVASQTPSEQERWLEIAAAEHLTKQEMRDRLRPPKEITPPVEDELVTCPRCHTTFWPKHV
jgi:hypothetical protein